MFTIAVILVILVILVIIAGLMPAKMTEEVFEPRLLPGLKKAEVRHLANLCPFARRGHFNPPHKRGIMLQRAKALCGIK